MFSACVFWFDVVKTGCDHLMIGRPESVMTLDAAGAKNSQRDVFVSTRWECFMSPGQSSHFGCPSLLPTKHSLQVPSTQSSLSSNKTVIG